MRRFALFASLILAASLCGCTSTTQQWASQREALTAVENNLTPAVASGKLTPTEIDVADNGVKAWRAALADAQAHLPAGGSVFQQDIDIAKSIGKRLADTYLAPATQPSK